MVAVDSLTDELRRIIGYLADALRPRCRGTRTRLRVTRRYRDPRASHLGHRTVIRSSTRRPRRASPPAIGAPSRKFARLSSLRSTPVGPQAVLAVTTVLDRLADRVSYLYSGSPDMGNPVLVVRDPIPCQPAKILTTRSKPGIRVCFHWCRKIPRDQLEPAFNASNNTTSSRRLLPRSGPPTFARRRYFPRRGTRSTRSGRCAHRQPPHLGPVATPHLDGARNGNRILACGEAPASRITRVRALARSRQHRDVRSAQVRRVGDRAPYFDGNTTMPTK